MKTRGFTGRRRTAGFSLLCNPQGAEAHTGFGARVDWKIVYVKQSVTVRSFEGRDLPGILRIEEESFDGDAWSTDIFVEYASAALDLFLVGKITGRIAGYSIACLTRHGAEIASLAVRPQYRQRGVATALLKTTIRRLRRRGARAAWLMVRHQNEEAIRLYCKLGFRHTATVPNYYNDGSSGWRMRIDLGKDPSHASPRGTYGD